MGLAAFEEMSRHEPWACAGTRSGCERFHCSLGRLAGWSLKGAWDLATHTQSHKALHPLAAQHPAGHPLEGESCRLFPSNSTVTPDPNPTQHRGPISAGGGGGKISNLLGKKKTPQKIQKGP
uniref:Uncharacterized protein n=1 Tax=Eutreptiella gymnastica TaxID=73025 RepID=A0A7S1JBN4_9EUGL